MNLFEKLIQLLQKSTETPPEWGAWHISSIIITALACVIVGVLMRGASRRTLRVFVSVSGALLITLELIKQFVFCMSFTDSGTVWDMQWYLFPFQFCSIAMYISLLAGIVKPGKLSDFLFSFLATFALLAGFIVMLVPSQVYCYVLFINVQTMIHHGGMLVIATAVISSGHARLGFKSIMKGAAVFGVFAAIALAADVLAVKAFGITETFNMFFISPYFDCPMPVFSIIYKSVPYPVFLLLYFVGFILGTCLIVYLVKLVVHLVVKIKELKYQP